LPTNASRFTTTARIPQARDALPFKSVFHLCPSVAKSSRVKLFYTGPFVNAEMLVAMLDKHGIAATQSFVDPAAPDDGDLSRPAQVFVPEADYDRAYKCSTPSAKTSCSHRLTQMKHG